MLNHTLDQISSLKLHGLKSALSEQLEQPGNYADMSFEERSGHTSHILTNQLPVKEWYAYFKNPTLADAIMDRVIHNAHRIELKGEYMRKAKNTVTPSDTLP